MMKEVTLHSDEITLGQLIKYMDLVGSGGEVRYFLAEHKVIVNGEKETRRGRKLHPGDQLEIEGVGKILLSKV